MARTPAPTLAAQVSRAEFILAAAVALVLLLVAGLATALDAASRSHDSALATVAVARGVRSQALALTQALLEAKAAALQSQSGRASGDDEARARADALEHAAALQRAAGDDPDLKSAAARAASLVEPALDVEPSQAHAALADLRAAMGELIILTRVRNDAARAEENRHYARLGAIAVALAALSLIAAALAIVALRREREYWRVAHEAADAARASAAASEIAKTRFLTAASHDMRQPLHALTLYLNALSRRVQSEEARDILAKAERAAQSLGDMFKMVLDLARLDAGAVRAEIEDVSLHPLFEAMLVEHPGANIVAAATTLKVRSDPVLLERILRNLVSNAATHGGGSVELSARADGEAVEILVADKGPGIALDQQERIFQEFVRVEDRPTAGGLGLGLAIVARLAALLEHRLEVRSTPGQGATFVVRAMQVPESVLAGA